MILDINKTKEEQLTLKQETFCQYYTKEGETFGNGTLSYSEAYNYDFASLDTRREIDEKNHEIEGTSERDKAINVCAAAASQLLRNFKIGDRIRDILASRMEDDKIVDAKLMSIVLKGNAGDAINAIKHRNDIKQRIVKKVDITTQGRPLAGLSDEELLKMAGAESETKLAH